MIRKKLFAVLLCGALISVLFAGCGDKAKNDISNAASRVGDDIASTAVSYTHLTLPTIA